jgi:hypothetical protein
MDSLAHSHELAVDKVSVTPKVHLFLPLFCLSFIAYLATMVRDGPVSMTAWYRKKQWTETFVVHVVEGVPQRTQARGV